MVWYDIIWYNMICYDTKWYDVIWYDVIRYGMIWHGMIWFDTIWWEEGEMEVRIKLIFISICLTQKDRYRQLDTRTDAQIRWQTHIRKHRKTYTHTRTGRRTYTYFSKGPWWIVGASLWAVSISFNLLERRRWDGIRWEKMK